jgi:hypothetical protein
MCNTGWNSNMYQMGLKKTDVDTLVSFFDDWSTFSAENDWYNGLIMMERHSEKKVMSIWYMLEFQPVLHMISVGSPKAFHVVFSQEVTVGLRAFALARTKDVNKPLSQKSITIQERNTNNKIRLTFISV